jgi:2,3-bisphosphoglycerate-independent phosphoglycerate mutase
MNRILLLFFDGWGLGANDPAINPFLSAPMPTWRALFDGAMPTNANGHYHSARATLVPTDATLGVPGLPQSGTGQTTIFTGVNAARINGEHFGPYPNETLRAILATETIFHRVVASGKSAAFANAFPPFFFDRLARNKARRSAMTQAVGAAGVRYRGIDDLRTGRAVSPFVTNDLWREHGADVPLITAHDAGKNLARLARDHSLTVFEYFLTDAAGHKANPEYTARVLGQVDELLAGVLEENDDDETLIVTTSDHGNVEDASAKKHTLNPVPTVLIGARRERIAPQIHSLTDIAPAVEFFLND